jgi:hypothetical protein
MSGVIARVAPLAAALAVAGAGCSADPGGAPLPGGPGSGSAPATASAAPSAPAAAAVPPTVVRLVPTRPGPQHKELLEGYQRFWAGLTDAYRTGRTAALVEATVDPARRRFVTRAAELKSKRQTQRGTVLGAPLVADLGAGIVVDCMDLRDFRTYDSGGKALFPRDPGTTRIRARLRSVGGRWRLADFETEGSGCRR